MLARYGQICPLRDLHVDFERDSQAGRWSVSSSWSTNFGDDNGATRFVPGSHLWSAVPPDLLGDLKADYPGQVLACGPAGSMIIFNGSVWHGHTANSRPSLDAPYRVPISAATQSGENLPARMLPETLSRIGPLAKYLLAV